MRRKKWRFVAGFVVAVGIFLAVADSIISPETVLGLARFKILYALTPSTVAALKNYDANLQAFNGSYIPLNADAFLCKRLSESASLKEKNAIVDFYIRKAGGREGQTIFRMPDDDKKRITTLLFQRLDAYDSSRAAQTLILIESMRQGESLGKAHLFAQKDYANYEIWLKQSGVPQAKAKYRRWWNSPLSWSQKKHIDPLKKSDLIIAAP